MAKKAQNSNNQIGLIGRQFLAVMKFSPIGMMTSLLLMLFRSLTSGLSLFMIIPLLQVAGFPVGMNTIDGWVENIHRGFNALHLPLNLMNILAIYIFVIGAIAFVAFGEQIVTARLQQRYNNYLRIHLYRQLLCAQWSFFLQQKRPELVHTLTTQVQSIGISNFQLLSLLSNTIMLVVYTSFALLLSWPMTLAAALGAILLTALMHPLHKLTAYFGVASLKRSKNLIQAITEHLSALKMIKGSAYEARFITEIQAISESLEKPNQHLILATAASKFVYNVGAVIGLSIMLYFAIQVLATPLESLLLLLIIFARLLPKVTNVQQNYQRILHHLPSFCDVNRLLKLCEVNQEVFTSEHLSFTRAITLHNVGFYWPSKMNPPIFKNISFCIKKNTTTAIIGPSGIGKTTLVDIIGGLLNPTSGKITIDDQILSNDKQSTWRKSVVYVTQDACLFNMSIRENLQLYSGKVADEVLWDALKMAAADDFALELEKGLDTPIGDAGALLSGGERQRIALTRALLAKPQLLILDEYTSALDLQNRIKIKQALQQLRGKITLLIISHQHDMRSFADQEIDLSRITEAFSNDETQMKNMVEFSQ